MATPLDAESSVLLALEELGPCSMDRLRDRLSGYTWSQVFAIVGKLSREGQIHLRHSGNFEYIASLFETAPPAPSPAQSHRRNKVRPPRRSAAEEQS